MCIYHAGKLKGRIIFYMFLNVTYSIIKPYIKELARSMAEELDLHASQVQIINFTSEGNHLLIRWAISPAGSDDYISNTTAIDMVAETSHSTIAVALTIIVALLLGLSVSATWLIWRRRQQTVVPYKPIRSAIPKQELQPL